jgi:hypothetical protein
MELGTAKEQEHLAEPLTGEDAERFVAYIENPSAPAGHNEYLLKADQTFGSVQPRDAAS